MPEQNNGQKSKVEPQIETHVNIGGLSFSDLFQGIGNLVDFVTRMQQEGEGERRREGTFTTPSGRINAVYGFSVKTGLGEKMSVESFGNVRKTAHGPVVEEERQPLVDLFDEAEQVIIIVELPGVEEEQIHIDIKGDILTLSAAGRSRKYATEVVLPSPVNANALTRTYTNGVLEIKIGKK